MNFITYLLLKKILFNVCIAEAFDVAPRIGTSRELLRIRIIVQIATYLRKKRIFSTARAVHADMLHIINILRPNRPRRNPASPGPEAVRPASAMTKARRFQAGGTIHGKGAVREHGAGRTDGPAGAVPGVNPGRGRIRRDGRGTCPARARRRRGRVCSPSGPWCRRPSCPGRGIRRSRPRIRIAGRRERPVDLGVVRMAMPFWATSAVTRAQRSFALLAALGDLGGEAPAAHGNVAQHRVRPAGRQGAGRALGRAARSKAGKAACSYQRNSSVTMGLRSLRPQNRA